VTSRLGRLKPHQEKNLVAQQNNTHDFHDSEAEDVYDLYNACNGVLHNHLLDVRKLDELSQEESAVLNVTRLREIWAHTATGCLRCKKIISTLNSARIMIGQCIEGAAAVQDYSPRNGGPKTTPKAPESEGSGFPF
jgi:hypothetical protein